MARGQQETDRLQVTLALKTLAFLDLLAAKGRHGTSTPDVAKTFIERGVQRAILENALTPEEVRSVERG
jgi:hypothetical protein